MPDHEAGQQAEPIKPHIYRFAREDGKRYPGTLQAGTPDSPYYTNSTQLPVGFTDDPFEALQRQEELQTRYTGGTVLHLYMRERISSPEACRRLVQAALSRFRLPYITVTPTFSICPKHGYLDGEHEFCPRCDEEIAARRVGGGRPLNGARASRPQEKPRSGRDARAPILFPSIPSAGEPYASHPSALAQPLPSGRPRAPAL